VRAWLRLGLGRIEFHWQLQYKDSQMVRKEELEVFERLFVWVAVISGRCWEEF